MKHLKAYNEEWDPIKWVKDKKDEIVKNRREKSIMQNSANSLVRIKMSAIKPIQVKSRTDSSMWKVMDFAIKTNQFPWDTKVSADIDCSLIIDGDDIILRCVKINFGILGKVGEAKGPGRRRESGDYFSSEFGTVRLLNIEYIDNRVVSGDVSIELGRHNITFLSKRFEYDEKTLQDNITDFISSLVDNLSDFYGNIQNSITERREKLDRDKVNREKYEKSIDEFLKNEELIKECFFDIIDISDDYDIKSDKNSRHIRLDLKIKGIDVESQSESKYTHSRNTSVYFTFDEAHINVTDELFTIMKAIQEGRSHLASIDSSIGMKTIFKKDHLSIILTLKDETSK